MHDAKDAESNQPHDFNKKNFLVNLNQPPKIIQLSNQLQVGLMANNSPSKNPILLYQMQQNQMPGKLLNQQQQPQQHQLKLIDSSIVGIEATDSNISKNADSSTLILLNHQQDVSKQNIHHVDSSNTILYATSNQQFTNQMDINNSNIMDANNSSLENCEFINSSKANFARISIDKPNETNTKNVLINNHNTLVIQEMSKPVDINSNHHHHHQQQQQQQQQQPQFIFNSSTSSFQTNQENTSKLIEINPQTQQQQPIQLQLFTQPVQHFEQKNVSYVNENSLRPPTILNLSSSSSHQVTSSNSKADEIQDHIDTIINEVAAGSGTIPYSSDFDDEESK